MKILPERGSGLSFVNTVLVFIIGKRLWNSKELLTKRNHADDVAQRKRHKILGLGRQAVAFSLFGWLKEESPDFAEGDTSERLGAVRLRKVSQKTNRHWVKPVGRVKYLLWE